MLAHNRRSSQGQTREDTYVAGTVRSRLACSACRRKKTRCDRTLPSCLVCTKLQQSCLYPARRLKPGPKSGTLQQRYKKPLVDEVKRKEQWQGDNDLDVESGDDDCAVYSEQGTESYDLGEDSDSSDSPDVEINFVKAVSLSSLIHPTHETCSSPTAPRGDPISSSSLLNLVGAQNLLMDACDVLALSIQEFQRLTDSYFDNMTVFSLFHRPSFGQKVQNIKDAGHLQALFAAMFSFSAKFETVSSVESLIHKQTEPWALKFHHQALDLIEKSLREMSDQPPPLCLLQALTVITFCELTNGVRGRAWRLLGSCVRLAYELHMHLIDYEAREEDVKVGRDLARWVADEEHRRCWWAIWEMDNFASTIRRCPTAIDWNMIDTYLPVQDEFWFNNQYQPGCFLEIEPVNRWKMLKKHGNESPNAWLIVISSIMRNAQVLLRGNLQGVLLNLDPHNNSDQLLHYFRNSFRRKMTQENSTKLRTLILALQNVITKLPESLVYRGEYLDFGSDGAEAGLDVERKRVHSAKYNIYLTIQLARFMIYHHYAFGEIVSGTIFSDKHKESEPGWSPSDRGPSEVAQGLQNCLQAADDICALIDRCAKGHVKHVSPFLASTVWLAASLQVLRRIFGNGDDGNETTSKCKILRATCERYAEFWQTPLALLENLDSLETRLCHYRDSSVAAAAANKTRRRSASRHRKISIHPTDKRAKPQQKLADESLNSTFELESPVTTTHGQSTNLKGRSQERRPSSGRDSSFNVPPQPSNPLSHCPVHDGGTSTNHDNQVTSLPGLDPYHPHHVVTTDRDVFMNQGVPMDSEVGLDSIFSQYLLEAFSEPSEDAGFATNRSSYY